MSHRIIVIAALLALSAGTAAAQPAWQPSEAQAKCIDELARMNQAAKEAPPPEASADGEGAATKLGPVSRIIARPDTCIAELRNDARFAAHLNKILVFAVHEEESEEWSEDQRHVWMAYIAIWVLTVGFLVGVWLRQGKLKGEIERLQADLDRALKEDAPQGKGKP